MYAVDHEQRVLRPVADAGRDLPPPQPVDATLVLVEWSHDSAARMMP